MGSDLLVFEESSSKTFHEIREEKEKKRKDFAEKMKVTPLNERTELCLSELEIVMSAVDHLEFKGLTRMEVVEEYDRLTRIIMAKYLLEFRVKNYVEKEPVDTLI